MIQSYEYMLIFVTAIGAGFANALAGGGTLISFPTLVAIGVPAVQANITNTVALVPGYLGGTLAQSGDLQGQRKRLWLFLPAGAVGGIVGALLLVNTGERLFRELVPYLILLASGLLAVQDPVRKWLGRRNSASGQKAVSQIWAVLLVGLAAVYGGYFGAGLSVIILAVLGLLLEDNLTRLNALKQAVAFCVNLSAAALFVISGEVIWPAALVMAVGALIGGALGGKLAGRVKPSTLRWTVVTIGVLVGLVYLVR